MKVIVNKDNCIGCGLCENLCPDVFKISEDDGLSEVICQDFDNVDKDALSEAKESCPTNAIEEAQ